MNSSKTASHDRLRTRYAFGLSGLSLLVLFAGVALPGQDIKPAPAGADKPAQAAGKPRQTGPQADQKEIGQQMLLTGSVSRLDDLEQAAKGGSSGKSNGVELAIKLKAVPSKGSTDIEIGWEISYFGPRSPLIILKPSFDLPIGPQLTVQLWAIPKGKDTAHPYRLSSPLYHPQGIGKKWVQMGPYFGEIKELDFPPPPGPTSIPVVGFGPYKDWFVTVPKSKSAKGVITLSGHKIKKYYLGQFRREFNAEQAPRFFVEVGFQPEDRGWAWDLDAWVGRLDIPPNEVPGVTKW